MTYYDILESIHQIKREPLTDQTSAIFADLLYIKRHWDDAANTAREENTMQSHMGKPPFTLALAEDWTAGMENEDGTRGPHWTLERIQKEMEQRGVTCDPVEFWAVINAIYSDDVAVAKKHGVNTMDYYIDRAKAWIHDKDAVPDKAKAYYTHVVQHS